MYSFSATAILIKAKTMVTSAGTNDPNEKYLGFRIAIVKTEMLVKSAKVTAIGLVRLSFLVSSPTCQVDSAISISDSNQPSSVKDPYEYWLWAVAQRKYKSDAANTNVPARSKIFRSEIFCEIARLQTRVNSIKSPSG